MSVLEGIDSVRNILGRCYFDEKKCSDGIKKLDAYRKGWNESQGCWSSKPLHNSASHGADAFRMLALSISRIDAERKSSVKNDFKAINAYFGGNSYANSQLPRL